MSHEFSKTAKMMFLLFWAFFFGLALLFFYNITQKDKGFVTVREGKIIIKPDDQGHYLLDGTLNGETVRFLIDTGATIVVVPKDMADRIGLKKYYPVTAETANGSVTGYLTRIKQLDFSGAHLNDVKAIITPGKMPQVLLGMNVLSQFDLSQKEGDLILSRRR